MNYYHLNINTNMYLLRILIHETKVSLKNIIIQLMVNFEQ